MDPTKKKILLVDDDKFLLNMYAKKLTNSGFSIETAENGAIALEKIKGGYAPDVLVVDIVMPTMDGVTFVKAVRDEKLVPRAKIVMLTNQSEANDIKGAEKLNIDGYIIKATTIPSEVVSRVREIISGKKVFAESF